MPTQIQKRQIATTLIDGWTPADATWTYASASTITVPSGAGVWTASGVCKTANGGATISYEF